MDKNITIKHTEITAAYLEMTGYFADEIVGAQGYEMRDELIAAGYTVEEIPTPKARPISPVDAKADAEIALATAGWYK